MSNNAEPDLLNAALSKFIVLQVSPDVAGHAYCTNNDKNWDEVEKAKYQHLFNARRGYLMNTTTTWTLINQANGGAGIPAPLAAAATPLGVGAGGEAANVITELERTKALRVNSSGENWSPALTDHEK